MKRCIRAALVLLAACLISVPVFAEKSTGYNYAVHNNPGKSESELTPIPIAYEYAGLIDIIGGISLNDPRDFYIDGEYMYIADTGNDRIVKATLDGSLVTVYADDGSGGEFRKPEGVYVDGTGAIYVADTENGRIVHMSADGAFVESFGRPKSDILGDAFTFNPRKVFINSSGILYLIQQDSLLTIDAYNNFKGYIGETKIGFNLLLAVSKFFASKEQREQMGAPVRPSFTGMHYSADGFVYAAIIADTGQIRKVNTIGRNLFPPGEYGERYYKSDGTRIKPDFCDITVNGKGIVSVLDANLGRVYQYDQDGNNLCAFGSGKSQGRGMLVLAAAIDTDSDDNIYILDSAQAAILVYSPTEFIKLAHNAAQAYEDGRYGEVTQYAEKLLDLNSNYSLAHYFMGKAYYKQKEWDKAKAEFRLCENRLNYSKAYEKERLDVSLRYFPLIVLAAVIAAALLLLSLSRIKRFAAKIRDVFIYR